VSEMTEAPPLDMDEMANSINGFDQIAIKKMFGDSLASIGQSDATMFMHVLYFVQLRRQGAKDPEARNQSLSMPLKELSALFGADDRLDPTAEEDRDKEWAEFVIGCGLPFTVNQFMELTINQRAQALRAAEKMNRG